MMNELIGRTVSGYTFLDEIGHGGMGVVFRARDEKLQRDVAIKLLYPHLASDERLIRQFRKEAQALAQLRHANIVAVYTFLETEVGNLIVMEFVEGKTLAEMIQQSGGLPLSEFFGLSLQMLKALEHAHKAHVLHRDLKPGNIIITPENEARITDFGLAKIQQLGGTTATQITGGSLFYCPPEQLDGTGEVDHRADLYSIGMTMYESLTGVVPFEKTESDFRIREKIVKGKIQPPLTFRPDLPSCLNSFLLKAIAASPGRRYQSATEMRTALEDCRMLLQQMGPKVKPFSKLWVYALTSIGAAAVLLLGYLVLRENSDRRIPIPEAGTVTMPSTPIATTSQETSRASVLHSVESAAPTTREAPPPSVPKTGFLTFDVIPRVDSVFVDHVFMTGRQPFEVNAGNRLIKVVSGPHKYSESVRVRPGMQKRIEVDFTKRIALTVLVFEPNDVGELDTTKAVYGCSIYLDNRLEATYTPKQIDISPGLHTITVAHEKYGMSEPQSENFKSDQLVRFALRKTVSK